ncbi:MAG: MarC family protein [Thermoplasmata archaeon]|nr:MarC family protein [Thermoplasmata archaeon]
MLNELGFFLAVTVSVFAIVDPFGALPFFVGLTDGFTEADRAVVLRRAVIVLGATLALFALAGRFLFAAFGFTLAAFEIAGGILLFLVAYEMLQGQMARAKMTPQDREEALARRDEISIVPLGIPLLAGPGAISTVLIYAGTAGADPVALFATLIAVAITTGATFVVLRFGHPIFRAMGRLGVMALTRVMGLILAAVGVQFVINGVIATIVMLHA